MGYPMTWKRLLSRNGLQDGGYGVAPAAWFASGPVTIADAVFFETSGQNPAEWYQKAVRDHAEDRQRLAGRMKMLAGDIRRLEVDTVDERYQAERIHRETGVSKDDIAAVLRSFMGE